VGSVERGCHGPKAETRNEFPITSEQVGKEEIHGSDVTPRSYEFDGTNGYMPGFGSAAVIYLGHSDGWAIYKIGSLDSDEFAGDTEQSPEGYVTSYSCAA